MPSTRRSVRRVTGRYRPRSGSACLRIGFFGFGVLCAVVGLVGKLKTTAALGAYAAYLSILGVGQTFTAYQWDTFLVECLFAVAILARSPVAGIWVLRLLAFRFMFLSGAVKLLSGDPVWADLSALEYHFETQPLPTLFAAFAHQLPAPALKFAVAATFAIELVLPFFIFAPRKVRALAAFSFVFLEVLILITGNYNFFNLLTIVLCIALLDDRLLRRKRGAVPGTTRHGARWLAGLVIVLGLCQTAAAFARFPNPAQWVDPLRVVNRYGLFAVMTTERRELVIEGSMDGGTWREYAFPFKPGDVDRVPGWATPHQPRLDWQMWFAALTVPQRAPGYTTSSSGCSRRNPQYSSGSSRRSAMSRRSTSGSSPTGTGSHRPARRPLPRMSDVGGHAPTRSYGSVRSRGACRP